MDKQEVRDRIIEIGIVPVVRASSAAKHVSRPMPSVKAAFPSWKSP